MDNQPSTDQHPTTGSKLSKMAGSCLLFLWRVFLICLLAVALGLGVFFGAPILYRNTIQPFERNMQRLGEAQAQQEATNQQLHTRLQDLQERLDALELQNDDFKQAQDEAARALAGLQAMQQVSEQTLQGREADILELRQSLEDVHTALSDLEAQLATLETEQAHTGRAVEALANRFKTVNSPLADVRRELQLVKGMEYLTRCRLYLGENNLGLAAGELETAQTLLMDVQQSAPAYQQAALEAILLRLSAAAANLPGRPILAGEDLEIAWQLLQAGLPGEVQDILPVQETLPAAEASATPYPTPTP